MKRRLFLETALAMAVSASMPAREALASLDALTTVTADLGARTFGGTDVVIARRSAQAFADSLEGLLLLPGNDAYESARHVWNGMIDRHPAMIALCASGADVAEAVTFAAEHELVLSVKGGGHSYPGKSVCDNGLMIDLSMMNDVTVDPAAKTATARGGALLGQLDRAALAHRLITTTGVVSHTGVGGFTLGGGMGRTDRLHGLAIDNLLAAKLVTADGQIRELDAGQNRDLFWAIRGGGGNFGIVTEFVFRLHPFNPRLYGGSIFYGWNQARDVLMHWAEINDSLPDAASVEPQGYPGPDGERILELQLFYAGSHDEGRRVFSAFERVGKPVRVDLGIKSYQSVQTMWDGWTAHGQLNYLKSGLLPTLSADAIDAIVDNYEGDYLPGIWFQHLGGASSRVEATATAYAHRDVHSNFGIAGTWQQPTESEARIARIREYYAAIEPYMQGFYVNLHEDTAHRTRNNYGVNYDRLSRIKAEHDPANLFRLNANIEPAEPRG